MFLVRAKGCHSGLVMFKQMAVFLEFLQLWRVPSIIDFNMVAFKRLRGGDQSYTRKDDSKKNKKKKKKKKKKKTKRREKLTQVHPRVVTVATDVQGDGFIFLIKAQAHRFGLVQCHGETAEKCQKQKHQQHYFCSQMEHARSLGMPPTSQSQIEIWESSVFS
jgi:hypothetical protein